MAIHPIVYFDIVPKPMEKHEEDANQAMFLVCVYIGTGCVYSDDATLFMWLLIEKGCKRHVADFEKPHDYILSVNQSQRR